MSAVSVALEIIPAASLDDELVYRTCRSLRIFASIPRHHHDVVALHGMVLVYETEGLCRGGIEDGALYVVEDQCPVGGMGWDTHDRLNQRLGAQEPRSRLQTSRRVVCASRSDDQPGQWWQVLPSGFRDGPFEEWSFAFNFVGKVAGVYQHDAGRQD